MSEDVLKDITRQKCGAHEEVLRVLREAVEDLFGEVLEDRIDAIGVARIQPGRVFSLVFQKER